MNHRWIFATGVLAAIALSHWGIAPAHASGEGVVLVEDGEPMAVIVLPNNVGPRSMERQAAELLATYIEKMSGAKLEVKQERELGAVTVQDGWIESGVPGSELLGTEDVPGEYAEEEEDGPRGYVLVGEGELVRDLGVDASELGPGGIRVKTVGNTLVVLGGPERVEGEAGSDDLGLRHAAIEVLEQLGVRYLWPGELGLVVPQLSTVAIEPTDKTYTPQIRRRGLRWGRLNARLETGLERLGMTEEQWEAGREKAMGDAPSLSWLAWQRTGGRMPNFGHAGSGLRNGAEYIESHPEWFAMQADGTRDQAGSSRWRLCKSNLELIEHVANDIIEQRNANPNLELVSLDPNDGGGSTGWCQCENCKALDPEGAPTINLLIFPTTERRAPNRQLVEHPSLTDRMLFYWNSIAERVTEEHPDLLFGVSAYSAFSHPPVERSVHPNLVVRYVPSHTDYVEGWKNAGTQRMFWRPNILLVNRRDGKMRSIVGRLVENMHYFADAGVVQTDFDHVNHHWATLGLAYYTTTRLVWNPYLDTEQIIRDYAEHGFGAGAEYIERYFQRIEALTDSVVRTFNSADDYTYNPEVVAELRGLLNAAEEAAGDPTISERVAFLRMGLNLTELLEMLEYKSWRVREGEEIDRERAQRLVDLNALMMRDIIVNHHLVSNAGNLIWATGTFARFAPIGGRTVTPSDEALLDRIEDSNYGLTGREDSLDEMLDAFGL